MARQSRLEPPTPRSTAIVQKATTGYVHDARRRHRGRDVRPAYGGCWAAAAAAHRTANKRGIAEFTPLASQLNAGHSEFPAPKRANHFVKGFGRREHECPGGCRFLYCGNGSPGATGDMLRTVLPSLRDPPSQRSGNHSASGSSVDGADRSQRHAGSVWLPSSLPRCAARS